MNMRAKLERAAFATVTWIGTWALLSAGIAIGVEGEADPAFACKMLGYGCASGIVFGLLAFWGCWPSLPLWLRGALYGALASVPMLLAAGVAFLLTNTWPTDSWTLAAALLLSGTFGYLSREVLTD